ncbi:DUF6986 family protein [Leptolyngbya sp. 7M]|uniref:DUF6986 family protein n=1 Tax=Leptolyngbya sp. 7M TaxID=2812896 RepID=UPI001B8BE878|nr:aldolase/citrate lyase family protein [Leptolyngbya sp. 7M]QYO65725.1 hypothetical protein JVX88_02735 [Leptolyngbya sp. 7M]
MSKTILTEGDEGVRLIIKQRKSQSPQKAVAENRASRAPVHVVYGGADRFSAGTAKKLGELALKSLDIYAPDFIEFAIAMGMPGVETLGDLLGSAERLERQILRSRSAARREMPSAWLAWSVYQKTRKKLETEPVEDFRIDFEDGYGFRSNDEEDKDAARAAKELAKSFNSGSITPFSGFRIKSFNAETYARAVRTFEIFLENLLTSTGGEVPPNFVVTLPKITDRKQVGDLADRIRRSEKHTGLSRGTIGIEIMIETPSAIFTGNGSSALPGLIKAGKGRVTSAHLGAYDLTALLGIAGSHQRIDHPACDLARQMMLFNLRPLGIRLCDSVTTLLPVPIHRDGRLGVVQRKENTVSVHTGWKRHFENVTRSMENGFFQSWDLHPNQLPARYAAVYTFFLSEMDLQGDRLKAFVERATRATLTGNVFDDAASAEGIISFFRYGIECGAFTEKEVSNASGLKPSELESSFTEIVASRPG